MSKKDNKKNQEKKLERVYKCEAKLLETKDDGEKGIIEAYVSVFGNVDSYGDIIEQGAFADSLKDREPIGVWSHDWDQPIAKTLEAREDSHGLYIKGQLILGVQKAKEAYELMKAGVIKEFSIGFYIEKYEIDEVNEVRIIKKIKLIEWSPVLAGANPATNLINIKSKKEVKDDVALRTMKDLVMSADGCVQIQYKNGTLGEKFKISDSLKEVFDAGVGLKAGKVLSEKNRNLVKSVIESVEELNDNTKNIIAPLKSLLEATEVDKGQKVDAENQLSDSTILMIKRNAKKIDKINESILRIIK